MVNVETIVTLPYELPMSDFVLYNLIDITYFVEAESEMCQLVLYVLFRM